VKYNYNILINEVISQVGSVGTFDLADRNVYKFELQTQMSAIVLVG